MKNNLHNIGLAAVASVWLAISIWCIVKPADAVSMTERRTLTQFPQVSFDKIKNGSFMSEFEEYTLDQFPMRDCMRTLKSISSLYVFGRKDSNGIYIADGYASRLEYPLNEKSVYDAADKITKIYNRYIKDTNSKTYLSIIPDKNYFLAEQNGYPAMDYERLFSIMQRNTPYAEYIDITDKLAIEDYYKTDTHWKQENIIDAADKISEAMKGTKLAEYSIKDTRISFCGVYYGQSALPLESESIKYVTNDTMAECNVTVNNIISQKVYTGMYDKDMLSGRDPYEMYLSGAAPVVYIDNPNAQENKELIVFRDSFGSSLVPLLVHGYRKITIFDTRYISPELIGEFADFGNADVLFVYSTLLINQNMSMKDFNSQCN